MKAPDYWGVIGFPVTHSLTPKIFQIVGEYMGFDGIKAIFIEARDIEEFIKETNKIKGNFWLSVTSPLKHQLHKEFNLECIKEIGAINQIIKYEGKWRGFNTDGMGFVKAVEYIGIEPNNSVLKMKGGGSTARSIAYQWSKYGGKLIIERGRRDIGNGSWRKSITKNLNPDLSINFDVLPGINIDKNMINYKNYVISYDENYNNDDFAIIMLVAQHLEAWKIMVSDGFKERLPSIRQVLSKL
jgi:shikimate dehydrogenase